MLAFLLSFPIGHFTYTSGEDISVSDLWCNPINIHILNCAKT